MRSSATSYRTRILDALAGEHNAFRRRRLQEARREAT